MPVKLSVPPDMAKRGYSQIAEITSGKLVLIAGQVPHDVNDKMVGDGNFEAQVEQPVTRMHDPREASLL
jgi:enamine deaminase RidA (YjgF/YER057c/UK114 family)